MEYSKDADSVKLGLELLEGAQLSYSEGIPKSSTDCASLDLVRRVGTGAQEWLGDTESGSTARRVAIDLALDSVDVTVHRWT